ncbi:MAG: DUF4212 domain-containing protein [Ardenticatenaceae bacterium]
MDDKSRRESYWKANVRLITILLSVWALVSLVASILLAVPLNGIQLGSVPLSFWFAQQGSIIIFVCLIFIYCFQMDKIDREHDVQE